MYVYDIPLGDFIGSTISMISLTFQCIPPHIALFSPRNQVQDIPLPFFVVLDTVHVHGLFLFWLCPTTKILFALKAPGSGITLFRVPYTLN